MLPTWKPQYSVNHSLLDAQHQELFRLALEVYTLSPQRATKEKVRTLLKNFYMYMKEHFKEEEAYMQSLDYPLYDKHKKFHETIIEGMTKILKEKKSIAELQKSMKMIAKKWLVEHILENDLKIEKWRKSTCVEEEDSHHVL